MARPKSDILSAMGTGWEIMKAIVNQVLAMGGGDDDLRRVLKDGKLLKEIASLIVKVKVIAFPVWKEIQIGGVTRDELMRKLTSAGHKISDWAKDIMGKPAFTTEASPE